ncbi:hypothetical protein DFJ74DRAFT_694883 [Hyaloraphidium curvatum]|nr:hypothetical protein DFJ74DRAFT_694883 [Hyaloraphidium curvatum]
MPGEGGVHTLREVNRPAKPRCGTTSARSTSGIPPAVAVGPLTNDGPAANVARSSPPTSALDPAPPVIRTIDLLVVYTPAVARYLGLTRTIDFIVYHDLQLANDAYRNSNISIRVRLVHIAQVAYVESTTYGEMSYNALDHLANATNGMEGIPALRNQYGADLVALYATVWDTCGLALLPEVPGAAGNDQKGFAVISMSCIADFTLAHELGHTMGCEHDREAAGADGPNPGRGAFPYSYGYKIPDVFRTIMAYECEGDNPFIEHPCPIIPHFSNPDVAYKSRATGIADRSDNARTINNMAAEVAGYRAAVFVPPVPPPRPPSSGFISLGDCGRNRTCCGEPHFVFYNTTLAFCESDCYQALNCLLISYDPTARTCRQYQDSKCPKGSSGPAPGNFFGAKDAADCPSIRVRACPALPPGYKGFGICAANRTCFEAPLGERILASQDDCELTCFSDRTRACKFYTWNPRSRSCRPFGTCAKWAASPGDVLKWDGAWGGSVRCPTTRGFPFKTALSVLAARVRRGGRVRLYATLARADNGRAVAGVEVAFRVNGAPVGRARTDGRGVAFTVYTAPRTLRIGASTIAARFDGNAMLLASSGSAALTVKPA